MTSTERALVARAIDHRRPLLQSGTTSAVRLLNGFLEGLPSLALDLYGHTLVIHDHTPGGNETLARSALDVVCEVMPDVRAAVWKVRQMPPSEEAKNGRLILGTPKDVTRRIREWGVDYAVDLMLNHDASFYLDTRAVREWAKTSLRGKRVLNTFAYTGSLGVAAQAGGAKVVQTDLNRRFLNVAKDSCSLNGLPIERRDFITGDFFAVTSRLKREATLFDAVFLDPPFFSATRGGRVDTAREMTRLVNKVRPLVADGGELVVVNNALYLSGEEFLAALRALESDGYVALERLVPVPSDTAGYDTTRVGAPPVCPRPFNHSTKIAVLRVRRRDGSSAPRG